MLKAKLKGKTVNDVGSMALMSIIELLPNYFFVSLLNSNTIFDYYREFINVTVNIQINDIRQLPIVIPSADFLRELKHLYEKISLLKKEEFKGKTINRESYGSLEKQIDDLVNTLYAV